MGIRQAVLTDLSTVKNIAAGTISEIYPHYYPKGAVEFFLEHHSKEKISDDIKRNLVYLCLDTLQNAVGTVTVKNNEICRLFVLPAYQGRGFGREMLANALLDASLPAKQIYLKRGYREIQYNSILVSGNDFLCYDVMEKKI